MFYRKQSGGLLHKFTRRETKSQETGVNGLTRLLSALYKFKLFNHKLNLEFVILLSENDINSIGVVFVLLYQCATASKSKQTKKGTRRW